MILSSNIEAKPSRNWQWLGTVVSIGGSAGAVFYFSPETVVEWCSYLFVLVFFFISAVDLYSKIIPNRLLSILFVAAIPSLVYEFEIECIISSITMFGAFTILNLGVNRFYNKLAFGWGDVKLITMLALFMGWGVLGVIYLGIIIGGVFAGLGLLTKKITRDTHIPMAGFLFLAFVLKVFGVYFDFL